MVDRCRGPVHPDGEPNPGIVAFYEELRTHNPDHPPYPDDSPWVSMPLDVGIDHVSMSLSHSERASEATDFILRLAKRHRLVIYDPQGDEIIQPYTRHAEEG